jgi:hypothetical protein
LALDNAVFFSTVLYIPLFLLHCGIIKPGKKWYMPKAELRSVREPRGTYDEEEYTVTSRTSISNRSTEVQRDRRLWSTILYPIVYCITILPLSIVRWNTFRTKKLNPVATFAVMVLFALSGVFNALLYLLTRTRLFQPGKRKDPVAPPVKLMEFSAEK